MADAFTRIAFLIQSEVREKMLQCLREEPIQASTIYEQFTAARSTVDRVLDELVSWGWAERRASTSAEEGSFVLTPAGTLSWRAIENASGTVGRDAVEYLMSSRRRVRVLDLLTDESVTPAELGDRSWLSQPTAYRTLAGFDERGWVSQDDTTGQYSLSVSGKRVGHETDRLLTVVDWIVENTDELRFLGTIGGLLPIEALPETTVISEVPGDPDRVLRYYERQLSSTDSPPTKIRAITPIMSTSTYRIHAPLIRGGTQVEVVVDEAVLGTLRTEYPDICRRLLDHGGIEIHVHPERLGIGLVIFDSKAILVGYQNNTRKVCIEGSTEKFTDWALEQFKSHRENSRRLARTDLADLLED